VGFPAVLVHSELSLVGWEAGGDLWEIDGGPGPCLTLVQAQSQVWRAWGKAAFAFAAFPGSLGCWSLWEGGIRTGLASGISFGLGVSELLSVTPSSLQGQGKGGW